MSKLAWTLLWLVSLSACAEYFPRPMSAAMLAHYNSGDALVAYLSQPDASPSVCDMRSSGPHLRRLWAKDSEALVDGLVDGVIPRVVWRACVNALLSSAPTAVMPEFLHAAGYGYRTLLSRSSFEENAETQGRLLELHHLYLERPHTLQPKAAVAQELFDELRKAVAKHQLGALGTKLALQLLEAYDLEHGQWKGRALDVATLDELFKSNNATALHMILRRGSSELLRSEAKRRLIRLHIAASEFAEVKADPAGVEETLMRLGYNPLNPKQHRVVSGHLDPLPWQLVIVQQDLEQQTASLIGRGPLYDGASALPLQGALHVQLEGVSQPITLCSNADALDPTPCVLTGDVSVGHALARIHDNQLQLKTGMRITDALELAHSGSKLNLFVRVAGVEVDRHTLPVRFESLESELLFYPNGMLHGAAGPTLHVTVDCPDSELLSFSASHAGEQRAAFVQVADLQRFTLQSRGAPGLPGTKGWDGSTGSSGSECQDGGRGGDGGAGGPGGPGGNGGDIFVEIACRDGVHAGVGFALLRDALEHSVLSLGGPGGPGGRGGDGGRGGSGGSARSRKTHKDNHGNEVVDDPGCSAGHSGSSGSDGRPGPEGPDGRPGMVTVLSAGAGERRE